MTNPAALRERAAHCRDFAREYDPSTAVSLLEKAKRLDYEAALLDRAGRERRLPRLTAREAFLLARRPLFGKRELP
jgi:hypothetical protein